MQSGHGVLMVQVGIQMCAVQQMLAIHTRCRSTRIRGVFQGPIVSVSILQMKGDMPVWSRARHVQAR